MLKIMRRGTRLYFFCFIVFSFCVPFSAFADTIVESDFIIAEDTLWTKAGSPYFVQGGLTIDENVTLSIGPGVVVQVDSGRIDVLGRLLATGTSDEPILFTSDAIGWDGIEFSNQNAASSLDYVVIKYADTAVTDYSSKDLSISNARIEDGRYGIQTYGSHLSLNNFSAENMSDEALDIADGSDVTLKNLVLKNVGMSVQVYVDSTADISNLFIDGARGEALAVYVGSNVRVASSTIRNVSHSYGAVEVFVDSSLDISDLALDGVSGGDALSVFSNAQMTVRDSSITHTNNYEVASASDSGSLTLRNVEIIGGFGDGVAIYSGGIVDVQDSIISGFTNGAGIVVYNRSDDPISSLSLTKSEITNNHTGLGLYSDNSSYAISNNSIYGNALYGLEMYGTTAADVSNNFWGDPSGPYHNPSNLTGKGNEIMYASDSTITFSPWLSYWGTPPDPCIALGNCASNVLFLPGIEGSRLYRPDYDGGTDQLWEPNVDSDVQDLYMNVDGTSARNDVYAKEKDVIDELPSGVNIYKSFIAKMNDLKTSSAITDWEPIAYDWRLSLDDILTYGNDVQGRIYYSGDLRATSTPYVIQELKRLAAASKTGKVTIVAHSNGGLLAKRLTEILGPTESARLIDKLIFVAVPQAGTPAAIPAGLHGYEQDHILGLVTSKPTARTFAQNSPMEYQLLPSASYFTYVDDPVVTFDASLTDWISRYGSTIHSQELLHAFLIDSYGRVNAQTGDINQPIQFNNSLLSNAETLHTSLDNWIAPAGVSLIQIAGWGVPKTVEGITYKKKGVGVTPEADFTIDGDGTVVVPSALWTSTTTGAVNYWVNLRNYNANHPFLSAFDSTTFNHSRILEPTEVLNFLSDQITNTTQPLIDYIYLSTEAPPASDKRLRYALHSPLTLNLYDDQGRHTGVSTSTGQVEEQIPGTYYTEFGDVKYLFSDADTSAHILMEGYAPGTFTFNIDQYSGDTVTASTTFKDIPTSASTKVSLDVQSDISTLSSMQIDKNGDGVIDVTLAPKLGEAVYEPPAPIPEPTVSSAGSRGGGGRRVATPITAPAPVATAMNTPAVITQPVITNAPDSTSSPQATKPVQVKKVPVAIAPPKKVNTIVPQTASVYQAFQQSVLTWLGNAVYNGLHGFWVAFKSLF